MDNTQLMLLVEKARSGDNAAFEQLYNEYKGRIYRFVLKTVGQGDAEDIMQDTFLTAMQKIGTLKNGAAFGSWLYTIAYNRCMDRLKESSKRVDMQDSGIDAFQLTDPVMLPVDHAENKQTISQLRDMISSLDDRSKSALRLYYYEERSISECADKLGISENAAKQRLFKARQRLKKAIDKRFGSQAALCAVPLGALLDDPGLLAVKPAAVSAGIGVKIAAVTAAVLVGTAVPVGLVIHEKLGGIGEDKASSLSVTESDVIGIADGDLETDKLIYSIQAMPEGGGTYYYMFIDEYGRAFYAKYVCKDININDDDRAFFNGLDKREAVEAYLTDKQPIGQLTLDEVKELIGRCDGISEDAQMWAPDELPDVEETLYFTDSCYCKQNDGYKKTVVYQGGLNMGMSGKLDDQHAEDGYHLVHELDVYTTWYDMVISEIRSADTENEAIDASKAQMSFTYEGKEYTPDKQEVINVIAKRLADKDTRSGAKKAELTDENIEKAKKDGLYITIDFEQGVKAGTFNNVENITVISTNGIDFTKVSVNGRSFMELTRSTAGTLLALIDIYSAGVTADFELGKRGEDHFIAANEEYGLVEFYDDDVGSAGIHPGDTITVEWSGDADRKDEEHLPTLLEDVRVLSITYNDNDFMTKYYDELYSTFEEGKDYEYDVVWQKVDKIDELNKSEKLLLTDQIYGDLGVEVEPIDDLKTEKIIYTLQKAERIDNKPVYTFFFIDEQGGCYYADYRSEGEKLSEQDKEFFRLLESRSPAAVNMLDNVSEILPLDEYDLETIKQDIENISPDAEFVEYPEADVEKLTKFTEYCFTWESGKYRRTVTFSNDSDPGQLDDQSAEALMRDVRFTDVYKIWTDLTSGESKTGASKAPAGTLEVTNKGETIDCSADEVYSILETVMNNYNVKATEKEERFSDSDIENAKKVGVCFELEFDSTEDLGQFENVTKVTILAEKLLTQMRFSVNDGGVMTFPEAEIEGLLGVAGIPAHVKSEFEVAEADKKTGHILAFNEAHGLVSFGAGKDFMKDHPDIKSGDLITVEWSGDLSEIYPVNLPDAAALSLRDGENDFVGRYFDKLLKECRGAKNSGDVNEKLEGLDDLTDREKEALSWILRKKLDII